MSLLLGLEPFQKFGVGGYYDRLDSGEVSYCSSCDRGKTKSTLRIKS